MKIRAFLWILLLIILAPTAAFSQGRLSLTWEVLKYEIEVSLPNEPGAERQIIAKANLDLKNNSSSSFSRITLRISDQSEIVSVLVNGSSANFTLGEEGIGAGRKLRRIVITVPTVAPSQKTSVTVNYKMSVRENSGLNSISPVSSQFVPMSFWYPTPTSWFFTGGADFAPFSLSVNGGSGLTAVSSGKRLGTDFVQTLHGQPFFSAGPYELSTVSDAEIYYPKGAGGVVPEGRIDELASVASKAVAFTGSKLGKSFDQPVRIICVKRGSGFSDAGTVFVDDSVLRRPKLDSQTVFVIAEGVAKSYLGNQIRVEGEGYGIIREGLSRFIANEFLESEFGAGAAEIERLRQRTNYSLISRRDPPLNTVSPVDTYYYTATANKGSIIWSYLAKAYGEDFYKILQTQARDGVLGLAELRSAFSSERAYLEYAIDQVTEMNLMIGLPQAAGNRTKAALRNLGSIDAKVSVVAVTESGRRITTAVTIPAKGFGEAVFDTPEKVVRVEVDEEKLYPQVDFSDDLAPREIEDTDPLLFIKREFDRQKFSEAERNALAVLRIYPEFDDAKALLARALLAQGKITEAQRRYNEIIASRLPSPQSLAWATLGLGEIAQKTGQAGVADEYFSRVMAMDAEYGATLGAVRGKIGLGMVRNVDESIKTFFAGFDRAVSSNRKADIDSQVMGGEITRFASNVAGQAQQWSTAVLFAQNVDAADVLVVTNIQLKLLNREIESGIAVFRLTRSGAGYQLSGVEIFEVG